MTGQEIGRQEWMGGKDRVFKMGMKRFSRRSERRKGKERKERGGAAGKKCY